MIQLRKTKPFAGINVASVGPPNCGEDDSCAFSQAIAPQAHSPVSISCFKMACKDTSPPAAREAKSQRRPDFLTNPSLPNCVGR
jgi:hypothetical protein